MWPGSEMATKAKVTMKTIAFKVDARTKERLEELAYETRRKQSDVIRQLILTADPTTLLKTTSAIKEANAAQPPLDPEARRRHAIGMIEAALGILRAQEAELGTTVGTRPLGRDADKPAVT